jgi:hypothetical protein
MLNDGSLKARKLASDAVAAGGYPSRCGFLGAESTRTQIKNRGCMKPDIAVVETG